MKVQVSPGLGTTFRPSSQSMSPLSGAVSGGHTGTELEDVNIIQVVLWNNSYSM